jgi:hypothetical protein
VGAQTQRSHRNFPIGETLRALNTLVTQGKVRYIGVSNWQAWKMAMALGISKFKNLARFDTLQAYYSIAGRDLERELVPFLEAGEDEITQLDEVSAPPPEYPGWMLNVQNVDRLGAPDRSVWDDRRQS